MKPPILFSRCGSDNQLEHTITGPNFAITGTPTYSAGKHNNGIVTTNGNYASIASCSIGDFAAGIIDMWIKPVGFSIADGQSDDGNVHTFWKWVHSSADTNMDIFLGSAAFNWRVRNAGVDKNWTASGLTDFDVADGELAHIAFVWNLNDAQERRLFLNSSQIGSFGIAWSDTDMSSAEFYLGTNESATNSFLGVQDNFKWWDNVDDRELIISKREQERGGLNDSLIIS